MARRSKPSKSSKSNRRSAAGSRNGSSPASRTDASPAGPSASQRNCGRTAVRVPLGVFAGGLLCLVLAMATTLMLVLSHFGRLSLPGCGAGGGCAEAAASWWGKVPGTSWPISFVGLGYFTAVLIVWLVSRNGISASFRNIVRLGVLLSVMYVAVMIIQRHICYYCMGTHAANLVFWLLMEGRPGTKGTSLRTVGLIAMIFISVSAGLYFVQSNEKQRVERHQEAKRLASATDIIAATRKQAQLADQNTSRSPSRTDTTIQSTDSASNESPSHTLTATPASGDHSDSRQQGVSTSNGSKQAVQDVDTLDRPWTGAFTGRFLWGPQKAQVRIVMITDFQCPDCRRVEGEVMAMLQNEPTVSLSVKHFPMCGECNPHFINHNLHPNACWAARAAEAAGILRGNDGFWEMNDWLFQRRGSFTSQEMQTGLLELGYDPQQFVSVMSGDETLQRVQSDIDEAIWLGLHFTPMVFINGVELRGVFAHNAVPRTVRQVLAQNPPPMTAAHDQPPPALEKFVGDWREQTVKHLSPDSHSWARGPDSAKVKIVMWGDYQEKYTPVADRIITQWMQHHEDVQYSFRHFPFNQECNPVVSRSIHRLACRASAAAEAAGLLGGLEGYWNMHHWLMTHQTDFNDQTLHLAASEMGLDVEVFMDKINSPDVAESILEDVTAARPSGRTGPSMLYRGGIPTIYINGKVIPRWRMGDKPILLRILNEAYGS